MAFAVPMVATALGASAATAATLGTIASVAGTAFSVLGALKAAQGSKFSAQASAGASRYNAAVATNNAIIARRNADLAGQQGSAEVAQQQQETRAKVGALRASQAASGIDVNSGSAVDVRSSAAETGQLSAINIRANAARKAYGYQQNASDYDSQSGLYKAQAKNEIAGGDIEAQSTLLGGLASAGSGFGNYLESRSSIGGGETWSNGDSFR